MTVLPKMIGMVHLLPLPGAPRALPVQRVKERALHDLRTIEAAGFDAVMVENFGDAPFHPRRVSRLTVSAMTAVIGELVRSTRLPVGVNVLRNDAESALAIAAVTGAQFVRVNVLVGAMVTDQGVIEGRAYQVARLRQALCPHVRVMADVLVKHAQPLGPPPPLMQLVHDTTDRGGADALIVTGSGTGQPVNEALLVEVAAATKAPVYIGSGFTAANAKALLHTAYGAIVGTALKQGGDPGQPVDATLAAALIAAAR